MDVLSADVSDDTPPGRFWLYMDAIPKGVVSVEWKSGMEERF